ncbi:CCA tRNA nucleotidyltransferase [Sphingomonas sp.]|uniref:CCA tRNA nucleotidyltransferase n=1 Tax=Sphingomonas sp. TaxID=28214 RepID=UPI003B001862
MGEPANARAVPVPPDVGDTDALARLIAALGPGRARYIGGWVRDTLLGLAPQDLDVATTLPPQAARAAAEAARLQVWTSTSGLAHGTIGVVVGGRTVEVTTLRRDVATNGRHAEVAFTDDWREDAARRDFTINALSADPASGAVHDHFGGLPDLARGHVRFIGDPERRIAEDHLRVLRFFRFHARFGGDAPDAEGYAACVARARDLMALSRERIAGELLKLLAVADPLNAVRAMLAGGILTPVLPEIVSADRLAALLASEREAGIAPDGLRRLAALLPAGAEIPVRIASRLRLSKANQLRLITDAAPVGEQDAVASAYLHGVPATVDRLLLGGRPSDARRLAGSEPPRFPLRGGMLIARGLAPGPQVAATLKRIEARWMGSGFPDDAALEAIVSEELACQARETR